MIGYKHHFEARSYNDCCSGKSFKHYYILGVCVYSIKYTAWNAHAPYYHLWPARFYHIFLHYLINGAIFNKNKLLNSMCFDSVYSFCLKHTSVSAELNEIWSKMYIGLLVKYSPILSDFKGTWILSTYFLKHGTAVAQWLRCCVTNRNVAGSIIAGVIGIFYWYKILPIALWPWGRLSL